MKKLIAPVAALVLALTSGCSTTNLAKVLRELKTDPATVEFEVMAPGWAVKFKRAWPLVAPTNVPGSVTVTPMTTLQVQPTK